MEPIFDNLVTFAPFKRGDLKVIAGWITGTSVGIEIGQTVICCFVDANALFVSVYYAPLQHNRSQLEVISFYALRIASVPCHLFGYGTVSTFPVYDFCYYATEWSMENVSLFGY